MYQTKEVKSNDSESKLSLFSHGSDGTHPLTDPKSYLYGANQGLREEDKAGLPAKFASLEAIWPCWQVML